MLLSFFGQQLAQFADESLEHRLAASGGVQSLNDRICGGAKTVDRE
jgi:hypothetical protein